MPRFRNVRVRKKGGGFRMQRARVLSSGKLRFVKNKTSTTTKRRRTVKKVRRRSTSFIRKRVKRRSMVRRRRSTRRRKGKGSARSSKVLIGLALTGSVDPIISNLAGSFGLNVSDDIIKLGLGYWLSGKQGFAKGVGYGLFATGARGMVGNVLGGVLGGGQQTQSSGGTEVV